MSKTVDILIVGAGTAGLSAAIYAARAGRKTVVVEELMHGGQIVNTLDIENYPALPNISGYDFANNLFEQAVKLGAQVIYEKIVSADLAVSPKRVVTDKEEYLCGAVIIANGARHRKLGCPGEEEFSGRGVSYCATCDGAFYRGKETAVVGGGNTALEDALFLSRICSKVTLIHRRDQFRAHQKTVDQLLSKENIAVVYDSVVSQIQGDSSVQSLVLENVKTGEKSTLPVDGVFVAVGLMPDNSLFSGQVNIDGSGYLVAGEDCKTNLPGVFAAGDTRTKELRQLVTAAADGAVAATNAAMYIDNLE